jgi:hypothetical protein
MGMSRRPIKTRYVPVNSQKYVGNAANIVCRSSWERVVCRYLDLSSSVIWWSSEEVIIPYRNPLDRATHRYYPDFLARVKGSDGFEKTMLIEVKPDAETRPPVKIGSRITHRFVREAATYAVNRAKWEAAAEFCEGQGWDFFILTEKMARLTG